MPGRPNPRDWLAALDEPVLADLLAARGDVLRGAPVRDLDDLADRLTRPESAGAAMIELPSPALQVLGTLVATGAGASLRRAAQALRRRPGLDERDHLAEVGRWVSLLLSLALVWPEHLDGQGDDDTTDRRLAVNPGVLDVEPDLLGLGAPVGTSVELVPADRLTPVVRRLGVAVPTRKDDLVEAVRLALADPVRVRAAVGGAPPGVAETLLGRARSQAAKAADPRSRTRWWWDDDELRDEPVFPIDPSAFRADQAAMAWARDAGLVFSPYGDLGMYSVWGLELPSEVVLALLDADAALPFDPVPPPLPRTPVEPEHVHRAASAAITETLALTMALLETLDRQPLAVLKGGGVGARELTRLSKALGAPATDVRMSLELAGALGLVAAGSDGAGATERFGTWRRTEPAQRAADLVAAWYALGLVPSRDRFPDGKPLPALLADEHAGSARLVRGVVLGVGAQVPGQGVANPEHLTALLAWRLPVLAADPVTADAVLTWNEAGRLGAVGHGATSPVGLALLAGEPWRLPDLLAAMLPATQAKALFGSDLTVVVPGSPAADLVDLLDTVAAREARGSAVTWRFAPETVRGALDAGHEAEVLLGRLRGLTDGALPQALEYLVRDVARRHGHVAVRDAKAVLLSEEPALLTEIVAHRGLRPLGLRQVAPTVLVSSADRETTLRALRGAGYLPVGQDADGVRLGRAASAPAGSSPVEPVPEPHVSLSPDDDADLALALWAAENAARPEDPAELAARLSRGEPPAVEDASELEQEIARHARRLSSSQVRHLAHATRHGLPVTLRYRSASGGVTVRTVSDLVVSNGYLFGWCHLRQDERYFSLASILSVSAA